MEKLTYEQLWDKISKSASFQNIPTPSDDELINYIQNCISVSVENIVDTFNESIESHNNKNYICNKCDGYLAHTGEQKTSYPPIDIYKCPDCKNIVEIKQKSELTIPTDESP